ncbi:MAG: hypothetical protein HOE90_10240 [Bacteriovoracaceae bacterium]|jgi:hypothetical protein|nr:hypothetical protein [Bacteriovoracaceae bacterium]
MKIVILSYLLLISFAASAGSRRDVYFDTPLSTFYVENNRYPCRNGSKKFTLQKKYTLSIFDIFDDFQDYPPYEEDSLDDIMYDLDSSILDGTARIRYKVNVNTNTAILGVGPLSHGPISLRVSLLGESDYQKVTLATDSIEAFEENINLDLDLNPYSIVVLYPVYRSRLLGSDTLMASFTTTVSCPSNPTNARFVDRTKLSIFVDIAGSNEPLLTYFTRE